MMLLLQHQRWRRWWWRAWQGRSESDSDELPSVPERVAVFVVVWYDATHPPIADDNTYNDDVDDDDDGGDDGDGDDVGSLLL